MRYIICWVLDSPNTQEYFDPILAAVKKNIDSSNEIIGEFMCQGKVSAPKQEAIKKMDMAKFESMKANIDRSQTHPDADDLTNHGNEFSLTERTERDAETFCYFRSFREQ